MDEKTVSSLRAIVSQYLADERSTPEGKMNLFGMIFSVILVLGAASVRGVELLVRLARPEASLPEVPLLRVFVAFLLFNAFCVWIVGSLNSRRR